MELDVISYADLLEAIDPATKKKGKAALHQKGIVGISGVPEFEKISEAYISAARDFARLDDETKQKYAPKLDSGSTEGYELGAEWFRDQNGDWQKDDKKASFYAYVPDDPRNLWPQEVDLKTPYLALGELIFRTGKLVMDFFALNEEIGIDHNGLNGYGRLLHYLKEYETSDLAPNWCGAHFDHGVFTGLLPAYYFKDGIEVDEPEEAGLFIKPTNGNSFEKIYANDKSIMLFQVGEFGQIASQDQIKATKHVVKKAKGSIERFTFALFYSATDDTVVNSKSELAQDSRYKENMAQDGSIRYGDWQAASYARYRAT